MISAVSSGYGVHVVGGYNSLPYISSNITNPLTGMVRINGTNLEAFNGSGWSTITQAAAHVELSSDVVAILKWAEERMKEEARLQELAEQYPAVKDLKEKLDLVIALVKDYNTETTP